MIGRRQFSISYLFVQTLWIALALAATRGAVLEGTADERRMSFVTALSGLAVLFWSTAIGGFFGRMGAGAGIGLILFALLALAAVDY